MHEEGPIHSASPYHGHMNRGRMHEEAGFSLTEMIVAMTVVAMLVALGMGAWRTNVSGSDNRGARGNLEEALSASKELYNQNGSYPVTSDLKTRLEALRPERTFIAIDDVSQLTNANVPQDSRRIYVRSGSYILQGDPDNLNYGGLSAAQQLTKAPDRVTMCVRSKTGKVYCAKVAHERGLQITGGYTERANKMASSIPEALKALDKPVLVPSELGFSKKDKPAIQAVNGQPEIRLLCERQAISCPDAATGDEDALFEWQVSQGWNKADSVKCYLDLALIACSNDGVDDGFGSVTIDRVQLSAKNGGADPFGAHVFVIRAANEQGTSETSYGWTILPDLPQVEITPMNPALAQYDAVTTPPNLETGQRTNHLGWRATQSSGYIDRVYCILERPTLFGDRTSDPSDDYIQVVPDDFDCQAPVKTGGGSQWTGELDFEQLSSATSDANYKGPLRFNNLLPNRLTVVAVNQAGASVRARFAWYVVDRTPPITVQGVQTFCYSPNTRWVINPNISATVNPDGVAVLKFRAEGADAQSGLYRDIWPSVSATYANWLGDGSRVDGRYDQFFATGSELAANNVLYFSTGQKSGMYTLGSASGGIQGERIVNIIVENGAAPYYNGTIDPQTDIQLPVALQADPNGPQGTISLTGGVALAGSGQHNATYWTRGPSVTFNFSGGSGALSSNDCAPTVDHYEYETSNNGGAWSGPTTVGNASGGSHTITRTDGQSIQTEFRVRAVDRLGNAGAWSTSRFANIDRLDPVAPGIDVGASSYRYNGYSQWYRNATGSTSETRPCSSAGDASFSNWGSWTACATTIWSNDVGDNNYPYSSGATSGMARSLHVSGDVTLNTAGNFWAANLASERGISQVAFSACDPVGNCSANGTSTQVAFDPVDPAEPTTTPTKANGSKTANDTTKPSFSYTAVNDADSGTHLVRYRDCQKGGTNGGFALNYEDSGCAVTADYSNYLGNTAPVSGSWTLLSSLITGDLSPTWDYIGSVQQIDKAGNVSGFSSTWGQNGTGFQTSVNSPPGKCTFEDFCSFTNASHADIPGTWVASPYSSPSSGGHWGGGHMRLDTTADNQGVRSSALPLAAVAGKCVANYWVWATAGSTWQVGYAETAAVLGSESTNYNFFDQGGDGTWKRMRYSYSYIAANDGDMHLWFKRVGGTGNEDLHIDDLQIVCG